MTTRWLFLHCFWVLLPLAPMLAQAAGPAPGPGGITTPGLRGPDATPLAALLPEFEAYAEQARAAWGTAGLATPMVHQDKDGQDLLDRSGECSRRTCTAPQAVTGHGP